MQQAPGIMGPPQRPVERALERPQDAKIEKDKAFDVANLNDTVTASGGFVDLREEEMLLAGSWRNQNSYDMLSQTGFGAIGANRASLASQQGLLRTEEDQEFERHRRAARQVAESSQHHLDNPFLLGNGVRRRMETVAGEQNIRVPLNDLYDRVQSGTNAAIANAPSVLHRGAPLEAILSLLSLASNERVRGLLEDAYGMARGRQLGSDGVVPPEWATLATGDGAKATTTAAVSLTHTSWDDPSLSVEETGSLKAAPQPTVAFPKLNSITSALTALSRQDRSAEEARLKLRNARKLKKESQAATSSVAPGTPVEGSGPIDGAAPSGPMGEKAPEVKMSKKQREALEKSARADMSEEIQTRSANATATMQLGGGKQYAWMKGGASTPAGRQVPGFRGAPKSVTVAKQAPGPLDEFGGVRDRKFGQWREDGVGGRGVQLRDWIGVLEMDGREKRTLGWAYARQGTENVDGVVSTILTAEAASSNMQADLAGVAQTFSPQTANGYIAGPQQAGANFSPRPTTQGSVSGYSAPQSGQTSQVSSPYVQNLPNPLQHQQHAQPPVQAQQQFNPQLPQQTTALGGGNAQTVAQPMSRTSSQGVSSSQGKPQQQQQQEQRIGGVPQPQQSHPQAPQASAQATSAPAQNGVTVS